MENENNLNNKENPSAVFNPLRLFTGIGAFVTLFWGIKMCILGGGFTFWDLACPPIVMTYHICKGIALNLSVSLWVAFLISVIMGFILSFLIAYTYEGNNLFKD